MDVVTILNPPYFSLYLNCLHSMNYDYDFAMHFGNACIDIP